MPVATPFAITRDVAPPPARIGVVERRQRSGYGPNHDERADRTARTRIRFRAGVRAPRSACSRRGDHGTDTTAMGIRYASPADGNGDDRRNHEKRPGSSNSIGLMPRERL